ncbi:hypothetical protein KFU94_12340 [Chloroflexi bacterium TSY]|nr:hypothetical protein [Chloroflexi bacterium TSY]
MMTSRRKPPLALSRLRAQGLLTDITARDLQFTSKETIALLHETMGLTLASDTAMTLAKQTEGWIEGLQLAALSLRAEPDPQAFVRHIGSGNRHISDYLLEEVLQRQSATIRDFLMRTAIFERFDAELCSAVLKLPPMRATIEQTLAQLEYDDLFLIPLERAHHNYRYHHLFAEFLRTHLQRTEPELHMQLHLSASNWFATHDMAIEAVDFALRVDAHERAAEMIQLATYQLVWQRGEVATVLHWLGALSHAILLAYPALGLAYCWVLFANGENAKLVRLLDELDVVLTDPSTTEETAQYGRLTALRAQYASQQQHFAEAERNFSRARELIPTIDITREAMLYGQGYLNRMIGDVDRATEALRGSHGFGVAMGDSSLQLFALHDLAEVKMIQGRLHQAARLHDQMFILMDSQKNQRLQANGLAYLGLGRVLYEWNRLAEATTTLENALTLSQPDGILGADCLIYCAQARLAQAEGHFDEALRYRAKLLEQLGFFG